MGCLLYQFLTGELLYKVKDREELKNAQNLE